jgi:uncharacterized protein (DUF1697 family)
MPVSIALLRGVNVGGAGRLPMPDLREVLRGIGLGRVETYIQSGNVVFDSDLAPNLLVEMIRAAINDRFAFRPEVFVLGMADLRAGLTGHGFSAASPESVHVFFLSEMPAQLDEPAMQALAAEGDAWVLSPGRFTLHTPGGIGRSRLAKALHRFLPGPMTARNLRTLAALLAMAEARA